MAPPLWKLPSRDRSNSPSCLGKTLLTGEFRELVGSGRERESQDERRFWKDRKGMFTDS